ncbi:MAG: CRTAC1 family protein, partial [Planctomycetes bacterium]|nr:CRTAC1 family protein [Planctomycetota bacterium]
PASFVSEHEIGRFRDIAPALGVDTYNLCGGSVVEDFDGDGDLDIVTSSFDLNAPLTYYRNEGDGSFTDASAAARTDEQLGGLNLITGDYDSDGDADILVLRGAWLLDDGRIRNSLLENDGDGVFTDVTYRAGIALPAAPTQVACWGDYDNDGDLDLFVGNESRMRTRGDGDYPSQLWRNEGDGTFVDVAEEAGVRNNAFCKGACWGDYDNDGDLDLYLSNIQSNRLLENQGDGTFRGVARRAGVSLSHRTFATWFFDYDNDGWLDLFVSSYDATIRDVCADYLGQEFDAHAPALFRNRGDGTFEDVAHTHGLNHAWLPMGASFGDLDNDGWLDVYLATGDPNYESLVPNAMLRNDEGRGFQDVTISGGLGHLQKGHGVSFADLDSDGDQDIYHQLGGFYPGDAFHNALFENPGHGNRFLVLELRGVESHASGFGARVELRVKGPRGERSIHRAPGCVSSFGGSPSRLELGLGDAEEVVSLSIRWPVSGKTDTHTEVPMDARVRATEGEGSLVRLPYEAVSWR